MKARSYAPLLAAIAVAPLPPAAARADDDKVVCADNHVHAQELRRDGKLRAARDLLNACASAACPALVRKDCTNWAEELSEAIPSIVIEARDARGAEMVAVDVAIDGERIADHLDGRAIEVDPGEHRVRLTTRRGEAIEQGVVVREGEHMHAVALRFGPDTAPTPAAAMHPDQPAPAASGRGLPLATFVFGGVAIAAFGSFAGFAIAGRVKQNELEQCAPNCTSIDDVHAMRTRYLLADVSLGVGVVATGLAAYFALAHRGSPKARVLVIRPLATRAAGVQAAASF